MTWRAPRWLGLAAATACGGSGAGSGGDDANAQPAAPPEAEAPVALNPEIPIGYPPALFEQRIEGDVILRLYADSAGRLFPESTRVAESSGYPALDSAALAGSAGLRFAPAKRHGIPVATAFLQPVEFRQAANAGGGGPTPAPPPPPPPPPPAAAPRPRAPAVRVPPDTTRRTPDTTRADTTRPVRPPPPPPPAPPPPLPVPPPPPADSGGSTH